MNKLIILGIVTTVLATAGCQSDVAAPAEVSDISVDTKVEQPVKEYVDHGQPYSAGPTTSPESSNGPNAAPPEANTTTNQAQAVTTNENIRLTLPRKTE